MIERSWHGRVPAAKGDAYHAYLLRSGVPALAATPGNLGVAVLRRTEGDIEHVMVTSRWESLDSIKRFAGNDYLRARYFPEDDEYLLEREPTVTHHELHVYAAAPAWLLPAALFGLIVPNGLFLYSLFFELHGVGPMFSDKIAVALLLDAFLAMIVLAAAMTRRPTIRVRWWWFVVLSLIGGLGFSIPFCWWLDCPRAQ
jgi:heme-degrading monooxygenase HmoA